MPAAPRRQSNVGAVQPTKTNKKKDAEMEDLDDWKKSKQLIKPKEQLVLEDYELKEIIPRVLTTGNSQAIKTIVQFDHKTGEFIPVPLPGNMIVVLNLEGTQLHRETQEARDQLIEMGYDPNTFQGSSADLLHSGGAEEVVIEEVTDVLDEDAPDEDAEPPPPPPDDQEEEDADATHAPVEEIAEPQELVAENKPKGRPRKLTNQFNFCERAALTYNNPTRVSTGCPRNAQSTQTTPPPMATFSANVLQWIIYDAYQEDYEAQQLEKELERERKEKEKAPVSKVPAPVKKSGRSQLSEEVQGRVLECWKVLERMINQNTYYDIAKDYRYWEDPSDEFREEEGTLLPLWKFSYDKTKKNTITDIEWNPYYYDLFAVCFGFLDFMKPIAEGAVCLFTLKNPSFPDYICLTNSGCMCVATHPKYPYMVVVGLYDGSVCVFNVQATCKEPAFMSNNMVNKHNGIVWEVKWGPDLPDGEMNFFSVSGDGRVNNWVLMQNDLAVTTILTIYLDMDPVAGPDGTFLRMKACETCVKFHPKDPLIYLVGTAKGSLYKCSTAYCSMHLFLYEAHTMPISRIDFNKFNDSIFISCAFDWRIKIWEDLRADPLFVFDVGAPVGDVAWAPYSSTVFAAVTTEGKVYVFDLNVNKYKPICVQAVVSKKRNKLTRLSFNPKLPIMIVGDDKGCITTLKLSPNLRIPCKAPKKQQHLDQWTLQCMKLDKLLSLVREPTVLTLPPDLAGTEEE